MLSDYFVESNLLYPALKICKNTFFPSSSIKKIIKTALQAKSQNPCKFIKHFFFDKLTQLQNINQNEKTQLTLSVA